MAIACFLLVTFFPLPLFRVPLLRRRIADSTSFDALLDVLRDDDDFLRGAMANAVHRAEGTAALIKAVGIGSPPVSFPAKGHHQVFGILPGHRGQCLSIRPELANNSVEPRCQGRAHDRLNKEKRSWFLEDL